MLEPSHLPDARRRRQIDLLEVAYLARAVRTSAGALEACARRSQQILFDACLVLKTVDERIAMSRRLLEPPDRR